MKQAPLPAPKRALGRADALRYFAVEPDPAKRTALLAALGLALAPQRALQEPPAPQTSRPPTDAEPHIETQARQVPARVASMLVAEFSAAPAPPDSGASQAHDEWRQLEPRVLQKMQRPMGAQPELVIPLMPARQVVRRLLALARQPGPVETDLHRLRRRVAQARPFWPLPWFAPAVEPAQWLLVVDADPSLAAFLPEMVMLCNALAGALGRARVRLLWLQPDESESAWRAALKCLRGQAVGWVLLSDIGLVSPQRRALWLARLRRATAQGQPVQVLLPCLRRELAALPPLPGVGLVALGGGGAGNAADAADHLNLLLEAASPFLTLDRPLLRRLRLALCPGSSPLLEQRVWQHPDLDRAAADCKWKPQRQAQWLTRLAQRLAPAGPAARHLAQEVWSALRWRVPQESPSQHLLQSWLFGEQAGRWREETDMLPGAADAWRAGVQYVDELTQVLAGLERERVVPAGGVAPARLAAAPLAHGLLRRLPEHVRLAYPEWAPRLRLAADLAQLAAGHSVEPMGDVDDGPLLQALQRVETSAPPQAVPVAVVQRGAEVWLEPAAGADPPAQPVRGGIPLAEGTIDGHVAVLTLASTQRPLRVGALPVRLAVAAEIQADQPLQLAWPGGHLQVIRVRRPPGVRGWAQGANGLHLNLPPVPGIAEPELMAPAVLPTARAGSLGMATRSAQAGRLQLKFGVDEHGAFCDLHVKPEPDAPVQRMRWMEPGSFVMGSGRQERERLPEDIRKYCEDESPQHEVRLTQGYWLADTPCTQGMWEAVMGDRPSRFKDGEDWKSRPVERVSWDRVQEFLKALQKRLPAGWEAGLPTEAQWEYAARAGTQTAYWWGDEAEPGRANWAREQDGTTPVKRYGANPWGLHDMHGNVWEWCQGYLRKYDGKRQVDPADAEDKEYRAQRGGSWRDDAGRARAAYRVGSHRGNGWYGFGFRLFLRSASEPSRPGPEGQGASQRSAAGGRRDPAGRRPAGARKTAPATGKTASGAAKK